MPNNKDENTQLINKFLNIQPASSPAFSADGRKISFIMNMSGVPQVWSIPYQKGSQDILWPTQETYGEERVQGFWPSPANKGEFIYACDRGGNENAQLFIHRDLEVFDPCLTPGEEKVMHVFGRWSQDGKSIFYMSNKRHKGYFDLYQRPLDGEERLVWQAGDYGLFSSMALSPNGKKAYIARVQTGFRHELLEINLCTGQAKNIAPDPRDARYAQCACTADGSSLFLLTDVEGDFLYIGRLNLQTGAFEKVITCNFDIDHFLLSADERALIYVINHAGYSELYSYAIDSGKTVQAALPVTRGIIGEPSPFIANLGLDISPDGKMVAFTYTTPVSDSNIYLWDVIKNQVFQVTRAPAGGFSPANFSLPELIQYPTFDNRQIPALLFRPGSRFTGPRPVLVIVHGGPTGQSRMGFNFFVQLLLANGFAVLLPNVRGSTGYGKTYAQLDEVEKRMDSVTDLAYGAKWLNSQPEFDGDRVAVFGASYGGFMVLASLTHHPDLWAAGIDLVGQANFVTFLENTSEYRREHREAEYGSLARDRAFLESIAPMNHLDKIRVPLMVIHGENDPRVPLSETLELIQKLESRGISVKKLIFPDEGHGIFKQKNKQVAYPQMLAFLLEHLMKEI